MRAIYAFDVGKTRAPANFAWARVEPEDASEVVGSSDIRTLAFRIEQDLKHDYSVAVGLEVPLLIPIPESADDLSRSRDGEGDRSWSAPMGSTAAMLAIHQATWHLRALADLAVAPAS